MMTLRKISSVANNETNNQINKSHTHTTLGCHLFLRDGYNVTEKKGQCATLVLGTGKWLLLQYSKISCHFRRWTRPMRCFLFFHTKQVLVIRYSWKNVKMKCYGQISNCTSRSPAASFSNCIAYNFFNTLQTVCQSPCFM